MACDQEGGSVSRLKSLFPTFKFFSPAEMAKMSDADVFAHAAQVGERLWKSGVNMNLAPPLDVSRPRCASVIIGAYVRATFLCRI